MKIAISATDYVGPSNACSDARRAPSGGAPHRRWHSNTKAGYVAAFLCVIGWMSGVAQADSITLKSEEVSALRLIVAKDAEASVHFQSLRKIAVAALDNKPDPIERAVYEGRLMSDPKKIRSKEGFRDMEKAEALAWAWVVTEESRFLAKAREIILAWARTNGSDGNPINETRFEPMIEAYDLIRPELSSADTALVDDWLRDKARKLWESPRGRTGNWQSHRLKIIGLIGTTIGDVRLRKLAYDGFKKQIANSFMPDGASVDFKRRDAMHYHLYAVQPLLTLACVAKRHGESLFTFAAPGGASLERAVEFIWPYAMGELEHLEFANSQVKFDRTRAAAGETNYIPHIWEPIESVGTFSEAGCLDRKYNALAAVVTGKPDRRFVKWRTVLNASLTDKY